jgi:pimeloyl-ACP methyl ester carboxylesterase
MGDVVLFFGGNGHASPRLRSGRAALARASAPFELVEVPYPGFEGRPRRESLDGFLDATWDGCLAHRASAKAGYATGIGALVALGLRARGVLAIPLIFQGPVLWGLEQRMFPQMMMRAKLARELLRWSFTRPWFQDRLARRLFVKPLGRADREGFFAGYRQCAAFADLFTWFTPASLRALEARFAERPELLERVTVWVGGRDRVVGPAELRATERALAVRWPAVEFAAWGHYPMIDEPEEWAKALIHALAAA